MIQQAKMAKTAAQCSRELLAMGAGIEESGDWPTYLTVDAPAGMVWASDGLHYHCSEYLPGEKGSKAAAYGDMRERAAYGVRPCTDPTCETCHPDPEDVVAAEEQ